MIQEGVFNPNDFPFDYFVSQILATSSRLSMLQLLLGSTVKEVFKRENDQSLSWHKDFYGLLNGDIQGTAPVRDHVKRFLYMYEKFLRTMGPKWWPGETALIYQKIPNLRIQLPGNVGVGAFHRDSDYGHGEEEVNFYVPLTPAVNTNTIWTETQPGLKDYQPLQVPCVGKYFVWSGATLEHGNKVSMEYWTRVSLDFRVIPKSKYQPHTERQSVNSHRKFAVGEGKEFYFGELAMGATT